MRALVVEDEQKIRDFLKESLEAEFFAVDTAEDGEAGAHLGCINDYDIVILDNILPGKQGIEVVRELRENERTMPILILSVRSESPRKTDLLNAGADDYLTKPFHLAELMARVRALLRRPPLVGGDVLTAGDITLDQRTGTVTQHGKELYLTRKEFMLLQYLMQNEGAVVSRGMILEHVWDMSVDIFSNTIESHIRSLRKKLDPSGGAGPIRTIPGRGYKIID